MSLLSFFFFCGVSLGLGACALCTVSFLLPAATRASTTIFTLVYTTEARLVVVFSVSLNECIYILFFTRAIGYVSGISSCVINNYLFSLGLVFRLYIYLPFLVYGNFPIILGRHSFICLVIVFAWVEHLAFLEKAYAILVEINGFNYH